MCSDELLLDDLLESFAGRYLDFCTSTWQSVLCVVRGGRGGVSGGER